MIRARSNFHSSSCAYPLGHGILQTPELRGSISYFGGVLVRADYKLQKTWD